MLDNIRILLKTSINSQFNTKNIKETISKNKAASFGFFVLFLYLWISILSQGILLIKMGLGEYVPTLSFLAIISVSIISSFFKASDQIYNFKNRDILLTYPIKISDIVQSRIILMYLYNLIFSLLIAVPFLIAYLIFVEISIINIILWIFFMIITPIIPICISTLINAFLGKVASRFKNNNYLYNILVFFIVVATLVASFYLPLKYSNTKIDMADIEYLITNIINKMMDILLPLKWIYNSFKYNSFLNAAIYLLFTVIIYLITLKYVSNRYININLGIGSKKTNYKTLEESNIANEKSVLKSLYLKELKTYTGSRVYAMNTFIGTVMLITVSVVFIVVGVDDFSNLVGLEEMEVLKNLYPHIAGIMISMACTTHIAISYEGRKIWFIKSSPIKKKEFYNSKLLLYFTIVLPAILIFIISEIINKFTIVEVLVSLILTISYMFFIGVLGLRINLRFLNYTWENETKLVKQSLNQFIIIMVAFIGVGIPITLIVLFPQISIIINGIIILLLLIFSYVIYNKSLKLNF